MTMLPNLHATMPWDILKDFEPISLVATVEWGLVVNNDAPYKSAADLIAAAKANPGKINYGSGGNGSPQHVAMEVFAATAGIKLTHVPYKGATQAALDVASGQVTVGIPGSRDCRRRWSAAASCGCSRSPPAIACLQFPDVPTMSESGLPGFEFNSWFALMAPARTPKPIIARLNEEVVEGARRPGRARTLQRARADDPRLVAGRTRHGDARAAREIRARDEGSQHQERLRLRPVAGRWRHLLRLARQDRRHHARVKGRTRLR